MSIQVFELNRLGIRVFYTPQKSSVQKETLRLADPVLSNCSHKHTYYELHVIESGSLTMQLENATYILKEGELCLVCPGTVHAPLSDPKKIRRFCLHFELLADPAPLSAHLSDQSRQSGFFIADCEKLLPIVQQLRSSECSHPLFSEELTGQLLSQMMVQLVRSITPAPTEFFSPTGNLSDVRTVHIDQYFNNRFYSADGEEILAKELGVSRRQLNRIIQEIYGKSYREKLMEVRTEAACELLTGSLSIQEISERMGYSTCSNFTAFFKNTMGMTPSEYRKKNRK